MGIAARIKSFISAIFGAFASFLRALFRREEITYEVVEHSSPVNSKDYFASLTQNFIFSGDLTSLMRPSTHIASLNDLFQILNSEVQRVRKAYLDQLSLIAREAEGLNVQASLDRAINAAQEARIQFQDAVKAGKDDLFNLRQKLSEHAKELKQFKEENGLTRPSRRPESRVFHFSLLLLPLLVECVLNGTLFAQGLEQGLIGGWFLALGISIINVVALGVGGSYILRQLHHRSKTRKLIGAVGLIALPLIAIAFNLFVAHYRDALAGPNPEEADYAAVVSFYAHPLSLKGFQSYLLLAAGFLCWCVGVFEGYKIDDPYPGYGRVEANYRQALDDFNEGKHEKTEELRLLRENISQDLDGLTSEIEAKRHRFYELNRQQRDIREHFQSVLRQIESIANDYIRRYHERTSEGQAEGLAVHAPHTWRASETDRTLPEPRFVPFPDEEAERVLKELKDTRRAILDEYEKARAEYESIQEVVDKPISASAYSDGAAIQAV